MTKFTLIQDTISRSTQGHTVSVSEEESVKIQRDLAEKLLAFQQVAEAKSIARRNSIPLVLAQQQPPVSQQMVDSSTEGEEDDDYDLEANSEEWRANQKTTTKKTSSSTKKKSTGTVKGISKHNHVCVICRQTIPSHRCYQSHYYLDDYKVVFPQFDGTHGKVCPTCYYKCYTFRMNKQRAAENGVSTQEVIPPKKRRERAASITKITEMERVKEEDLKRMKVQLEEKDMLITFLKKELQVTKERLEIALKPQTMHLPPIQYSDHRPHFAATNNNANNHRYQMDIPTYH